MEVHNPSIEIKLLFNLMFVCNPYSNQASKHAGYKFDDKKPDSPLLRIHFAHFPFRLPSDRDEQRFGGLR